MTSRIVERYGNDGLIQSLLEGGIGFFGRYFEVCRDTTDSFPEAMRLWEDIEDKVSALGEMMGRDYGC